MASNNALKRRLWLQADYPAMSEVRPLYPRQPTFQTERLLSPRFRLLYTWERTFMWTLPDFRC